MKAATLVFALVATALCPSALASDDLRVEAPPGFALEKVASDPAIMFPMFACFDDRGRLFVAESSGLDLYEELQKQTRKCRVSMLEDRDGDGRFERATVFAEKLVFPMGLAWRDGALYVADPPDLITLRDTDGDGRADERAVILSGFGHLDNGSLHGLTFGPDDMLYMTTGNPDGYHLKQADGSILSGQCGALLRCRPDGSHPQVIARGFENLVEIAFLPSGDIIGTDNWYQVLSAGLRDALVHLVEGGRYPLHQRDVGTQHVITGDWLPPVSMLPAVALSGLMRYEGASLPPEMHGNLFAAQHNARKVSRHVIERSGATFRSRDADFVSSPHPDFHPSDVLEDADGSLLVVDTGGWYVQHCPTGRIRNSRAPGGIYRIRFSAAQPVHDAWGLTIDWNTLPPAQAANLLQDARPMVRRKAARSLVVAGDNAVQLLRPLLNHTDATIQSHAAWTLAAMGSETAVAAMRQSVASNPNNPVTLRALASRADQQAAASLQQSLTRCDDPAVRLALADALLRCGSATSAPFIFDALARETDRFVEHALIVALHRLADRSQLLAALDGQRPPVQKAALLLLDQPPHDCITAAQVVSHISSPDAQLRKTAQTILARHPEWVQEALVFFRSALRDPKLSAEDQRRLADSILAFSGRQEVVDWLADVLADQSAAPDPIRRGLILDVMTRVGRPDSPTRWAGAFKSAVEDPTLRDAAIRALAALQMPELDEPLLLVAQDASVLPHVRIDALRAVIERHSSLTPGALKFLLSQFDAASPPTMRLAAVEVLAKADVSSDQLTHILHAVRHDSLVSPDILYPLLLRCARPETAAALIDYVGEAIKRGWRPDEQKLAKLLEPLGDAQARLRVSLLKHIRQENDRRVQHLESLQPLLSGGDASRGRAVFFSRTVACSTCHRIGDVGGVVGPDLTKVGGIRSGRDILESIVFPSSSFAQGYDNYIVKLRSGADLTGIISQRSADGIVLRDSSGSERRLRSNEISSMRRDAVSAMPQGLERAVSTEELRDLLSFLQSLK